MMDWNLILAALAGSVLPALAVIWAKNHVQHHVQELHLLINSRMTELLDAAKAQATAEATLIEKEAHNGHALDELVGAQKKTIEDKAEKDVKSIRARKPKAKGKA